MNNKKDVRHQIKKKGEIVVISRREIHDWNKEYLIGVYLDPDDYVKKVELISIGTLDGTMVHPRDIFRPAICEGAKSFYLLHNHPSGRLKPSKADLNITKTIIKASKLLSVEIKDHIVFSQTDYYSIKDKHRKIWKEAQKEVVV